MKGSVGGREGEKGEQICHLCLLCDNSSDPKYGACALEIGVKSFRGDGAKGNEMGDGSLTLCSLDTSILRTIFQRLNIMLFMWNKT